MSVRARLLAALLAVVLVVASAAAFAAGRSSVDRTPRSLPAARVVSLSAPRPSTAIVLPPRAVLP